MNGSTGCQRGGRFDPHGRGGRGGLLSKGTTAVSVGMQPQDNNADGWPHTSAGTCEDEDIM